MRPHYLISLSEVSSEDNVRILAHCYRKLGGLSLQWWVKMLLHSGRGCLYKGEDMVQGRGKNDLMAVVKATKLTRLPQHHPHRGCLLDTLFKFPFL